MNIRIVKFFEAFRMYISKKNIFKILKITKTQGKLKK